MKTRHPKNLTEPWQQCTVLTYRCEFWFKGQRLSASSENGLKVFTNGFWLNDDYKLIDYPAGDEEASFVCKYWIPPNKIDFVAVDRITVH